MKTIYTNEMVKMLDVGDAVIVHAIKPSLKSDKYVVVLSDDSVSVCDSSDVEEYEIDIPTAIVCDAIYGGMSNAWARNMMAIEQSKREAEDFAAQFDDSEGMI